VNRVDESVVLLRKSKYVMPIVPLSRTATACPKACTLGSRLTRDRSGPCLAAVGRPCECDAVARACGKARVLPGHDERVAGSCCNRSKIRTIAHVCSVLGSVAPIDCITEIVVGADHVMPWSVERIVARVAVDVAVRGDVEARKECDERAVGERDDLVVDRLVVPTRVVDRPRGFPAAAAIDRATEIGRAVARVRQTVPDGVRKAGAEGSAKIDSLSLKGFAPSRISVAGALHVKPPSSERLARIALLPPLSNAAAIW
jgi:hypothetical protein